jgi:predicted nuclease of predicted toxin-antitoxin system
MLRFHLDENVDHAIAVGLRGRGIDVTTTHEAGLGGATDEHQLAWALEQQRVIVTYDEDLLVLSRRGTEHAGIAFCALRSRSIGQIVLKLASLSRHYEPADIAGRVEYL